MNLALVEEDLDVRSRGEITVGTAVANQLLGAEVFVLVLLDLLSIGRLALETATLSPALQPDSRRSPGLGWILSQYVLNTKETSGKTRMMFILMYQQLCWRMKSLKAVETLELTVTMVFDDVIHQLGHSLHSSKAVAAPQQGVQGLLVC